MGWIACALLIVDAEASDRPMYLILPSATSFLSSPIYVYKLKGDKTPYKYNFFIKEKLVQIYMNTFTAHLAVSINC